MNERAQAAVEFALVSMTLLLFLVGSLDFGRGIYYYDVLSNSTRHGARSASVLSGSDWDIDGNSPGTYAASSYLGTSTVVGAAGSNGMGMDSAAIQVTISTPMGTAPGLALPVTVSAQYVYRPFATTLLGAGPITLTAQSTMRMR